jgi:hypothetical protein
MIVRSLPVGLQRTVSSCACIHFIGLCTCRAGFAVIGPFPFVSNRDTPAKVPGVPGTIGYSTAFGFALRCRHSLLSFHCFGNCHRRRSWGTAFFFFGLQLRCYFSPVTKPSFRVRRRFLPRLIRSNPNRFSRTALLSRSDCRRRGIIAFFGMYTPDFHSSITAGAHCFFSRSG